MTNKRVKYVKKNVRKICKTVCKWFYEPIYKTNYYFIVCKSQQDFLDRVKKDYGAEIEFSEGCYAKTALLQMGDMKNVLVVWVKSFRSYSQFAHELIHVISDLSDRIDTDLTFDNSEPMAYLGEYLFNQFLDKKGWKCK